jgi:DNA-directed RNA polymerase beta subunit
MNKYLPLFTATTILLCAATPKEIIKKEFDQNILPNIVKQLNNNGESIIIMRIYKTNKSVTIKTYKVNETFAKTDLLEKEGSYNLGYKYYTKYILKRSKIKVTDFLKMLNIKTDEDLDKYFANNAALLIKKLKEEEQKYALEGLEEIIKKGKLNDLKAFFKGVLAGKVPASCS